MGVVVGGGGGVLLRVCLWLISIVVVVLLMRLSTVAVQGGRGIWVISFILKRVAFNSLRENLLGGLKKASYVKLTQSFNRGGVTLQGGPSASGKKYVDIKF